MPSSGSIPPRISFITDLMIVVPFFILLAGCGTFSQIERNIDDFAALRYAYTGDLHAEIRDLAQPQIEQDTTPGFVVGVLLPDGSKQFFGCGVTEHGAGRRRPGDDTLFALGSTTKGFVSATAAILVQEGSLSWDDTLEDFLADRTRLSSDAAKITLLQLATHSSGLPRQPFTPRFAAYFMQYLLTGKNFYRHIDRDYLMDYLSGFRASSVFTPGYSNIGYGILGHVMELHTGKKLGDLMHEKLLEPLELNATGFEPAKLPGHSERARPHAGDHPKFMRRGKPVPEWQFTEILLGAAGLYSNAEDLLTFARAHLYPVDDALLDRALQDTLKVRHERSGISRAPAWAVEAVGGHEITYQIGFVSGYSAYIGMDRDNKTAVVVLQNSLNWTENIGHQLLLRMARAALFFDHNDGKEKDRRNHVVHYTRL